MTSSIKLWLKSAGVWISQRMAYRGEYFISLVSMFVLELIGPIFAFLVYHNSNGFSGWTFYQVLLLQGIFLTVKGFSFATFFGIVWHSDNLVKKGELDLLLIKPRNTLFMLICNSFDAEDIAKFIGGLIISTYALWHISGITLVNATVALFGIILGIGLFFAVALFSSSIILRHIGSEKIYEVFDTLNIMSQYPKSIYPKFVGTIFTAILPLFVIAALPAQALFGNATKDILISAISVIILISIALKLWFNTIKKYASVGG